MNLKTIITTAGFDLLSFAGAASAQSCGFGRSALSPAKCAPLSEKTTKAPLVVERKEAE